MVSRSASHMAVVAACALCLFLVSGWWPALSVAVVCATLAHARGRSHQGAA
jgi:nitrate reductase NapE component